MPRLYGGECVPAATLEEYLDRLEEIIETAPTMPFTGKCVLERKELQGLLSAMRGVLEPALAPDSARSLRHANLSMPAGQKPLSNEPEWESSDHSHGPFNKPLTEEKAVAEEKREIADARALAEQIVESAKAEASRIRAGADEYAENALASIEQNALSAARAARKGLDVLQRRRGQTNN